MKKFNCKQGECGMILKSNSCCYFCEYKSKCRSVCSKIEEETTINFIVKCSDFEEVNIND